MVVGVSAGAWSWRGGGRAVRLWADADLRYPLEAAERTRSPGLLQRFEQETGIRVNVEYGDPHEWMASSAFQPGDLVLTADGRLVARLEHGVGLQSNTPVARHVPVVLVNTRNQHEIKATKDLLNPRLHLGIVSTQQKLLGRFTIAQLSAVDVPAAQVRAQRRFQGEDGDTIAGATQAQRVEAAIVWRDTALRYPARTRFLEWPDQHVVGPVVRALIPAGARRSGEAQQLAGFLVGPQAEDVFRHYGFDTRDLETWSVSASP